MPQAEFARVFEQDDVDEIVSLVRRSGAIDDSFNHARQLIGEAREALEVVPSGPARDILDEIAGYVIDRPR